MAQQVTSPPDGWTIDKDEMDTELYWAADGGGSMVAASVGLTDSKQLQPQMIKSRDAGGDAYVFTYGDKCYLWNMVTDDVYQYVSPADLQGVLAEMRKPNITGKVEVQLLQNKS